MNWKCWIILLVILSLGSWLRFYQINERGVFLWDEAAYLIGAKKLNEIIIDTVKNPFQKKDYVVEDTFTKPLHLGLIWIFSWFIGFKEYTNSIVSIFFGIGTVFLIFIIGKIMYGVNTGLISAFILSISAYHIMYSRSGLPDANSIFLTILSVYFYYVSRINKEKRLPFVLSGVLVGCIFLCNFRFFLVPLCLFLFELFFLKRFPRDIKRFFLFCFSMSIPIIGWITISTTFSLLITGDFLALSYLKQLGVIFNFHLVSKGSSLHIEPFRDIFFYPQILWYLDGGIVFLCTLLGIMLFIKRHTLQDRLVLSLFSLPLIFWSIITPKEIIYTTQEVIPLRYTRSISIILPFMALLAGNFISQILYSGYLKWVKILIIGGILILGIESSMRIVGLKSGYKQAIEYLEKVGIKKHLTTIPATSILYTGINDCKYPPPVMDELKKLCIKENYHYLLIDWHKYLDYNNSIIKIEEDYQPIAIFPNEYTIFPILCETYSADFVKQIIKHDPFVACIKIYDLGDFLFIKGD